MPLGMSKERKKKWTNVKVVRHTSRCLRQYHPEKRIPCSYNFLKIQSRNFRSTNCVLPKIDCKNDIRSIRLDKRTLLNKCSIVYVVQRPLIIFLHRTQGLLQRFISVFKRKHWLPVKIYILGCGRPFNVRDILWDYVFQYHVWQRRF